VDVPGCIRSEFWWIRAVWIVGEIKGGWLWIGETSVEVYSPLSKTKVPDVLFYENAQVVY